MRAVTIWQKWSGAWNAVGSKIPPCRHSGVLSRHVRAIHHGSCGAPSSIDARRIFEKCKKVTRDVTFRSFILTSVCVSGPLAINIFLFFSIIVDYAFTTARVPVESTNTCVQTVRMCFVCIQVTLNIASIILIHIIRLSSRKLINVVKFLTLSVYR